MRAILAGLRDADDSLPEQVPGRIHLENQTVFEQSIAGLCAWIKSHNPQAPGASELRGNQLLATFVELRGLAEAGKVAEALERAMSLYPMLNPGRKQALGTFYGQLSRAMLGVIEQWLIQGNRKEATELSQRVTALIQGTPGGDEFQGSLQEILTPRLAEKASAPETPSTAVASPEAHAARRSAELLLRDYANELGLAENKLEQEFLEAVVAGSDGAFKRKEKLKHRLQKRTRWGGREPYKTTLKLVESAIDGRGLEMR